MTVRELLEVLRLAPPDAVLLIPGGDHGYTMASASVTTALKSKREWTEDHGEELTPEKEYGKRVAVVVIS